MKVWILQDETEIRTTEKKSGLEEVNGHVVNTLKGALEAAAREVRV